jgi:hypothetical protein
LLNQYIVGADVTKTIGAAGAAAGSGQENAAAGAPGPQGAEGANSIVLSVSQMPAHNHGGTTSTVGFNNQAAQGYSGVGALANDTWGTGVNALNGETCNHNHTISSQGSGTSVDNRPLTIGLVPIIKVLILT